MRRIEHTPIDDDAETDGIRPLEACMSLSTEGTIIRNMMESRIVGKQIGLHPLN